MGIRLWSFAVIAALTLTSLCAAAKGQQPDEAAIIRGVDAAVKARLDGIARYTVTEHYAVFRGDDEVHPAAGMTVNTTYNRETGKSYAILAESGSAVLQKFVLHSILENEKRINEPGVREGSWLTSANYEMKLKAGGTERVDGRDCFVLSINPRQKAPNLIVGTLWVNTEDESIVQIKGTASKSVSSFTGPADVMRQYTMIDDFAEATHARAVSQSFLFGRTVVTIDYSGYKIERRATR
jgi:hypothetical protein